MLRTFCYQSFEVAPSWSGTPSILFFSSGFFLCCWIFFYFRFLSLGKKERGLEIKTAEITPLPEQGNHELPINNRPISLLPALSKVCERVAHNQFVIYLTTKERPARLTTKQNGNKKWFSTETSLIHTTDAFLKGIDDKKLTACVLLDMSKAFDSVEHQILLRKIQSVGASTSALNGLTATFQIDIKLYEFIVPFLILFQLNVAFLKAVF